MLDADLDRAFDELVVEIERTTRPPGAARVRSTLLARRATVAVVAVVALVGGGVAVGSRVGADAGPRPATPPTTQTAIGGDSVPVLPTTVIDGHWHTRHLAPAEVVQLLTSAGAENSLARWTRHAPNGKPRLTLAASVAGGYSFWLGTDRRPYVEPLDWGNLSEDGDDVVLTRRNAAENTATLHPDVHGKRLTLTFVSTDWPEGHGVSGADQVRALYGSLPLLRYYGTGPE